MRRCVRRFWVFKKKVFEYNGHQIRKGADLSGANLSGLVGRDALAVLGSLEDVNFANANLTGANFDGLELNQVNFAGANLTGASFKKCWFPQYEKYGFSGANLSNATITPLDVFNNPSERPEWWSSLRTQVHFSGANLDGATLSGMFVEFNFKNASLRGARIVNGYFNGCTFDGADFTSAHFEGKEEFDYWRQANSFSQCDLSSAKFHDVSGCAYLLYSMVNGPAPEFKVLNGVIYLDGDLCGDSRWGSRAFDAGRAPWDANVTAPTFYALTPQGLTPAPSPSTSENSSVESKLAEAKQLLEDGLIDQAEHDALRRKILGI